MSTTSDSAVAKPSNKLEAAKKAIHDFLYQKSALTPFFEQIEKYAKLKREYLFLGGCGAPSKLLSAGRKPPALAYLVEWSTGSR